MSLHATHTPSARPAMCLARLGTALLLAVSLAAIPGLASGAGTLDQSQAVTTTGSSLFYDSIWDAQTYTAGLSGNQDQVDLFLSMAGSVADPIDVQIRTTTGGYPTDDILASASIAPSLVTASGTWVTVLFTSPPTVTAGTMYAIVLHTEGGSTENYYFWNGAYPGAYSGGNHVGRTDDIWSEGDGQFDHAFKTYVTPGLLPPPTVTKTGTISGSLTLSSGVTEITDATVTGSITVSQGAGLILTNSSVGGSVKTAGASTVGICGSTITGSLTVSNSTGFVLVGSAGDDSQPCANNTMKSSVTLSGNKGGVELSGNQIKSSVTVTNNSGSGPDEENAVPEIEANKIGGSLSCSGNSPAPKNDGKPNTTGGAKTGQCSGF